MQKQGFLKNIEREKSNWNIDIDFKISEDWKGFEKADTSVYFIDKGQNV